jgi:amino acid adenylation domain-containing protein
MERGEAALAAQRALRNPQPVDTAVGVFTRVEGFATAEPDRVAVIAGSGTVSYGQLWRRARQLRTALAASGCGTHHRVAVVGARSLDTLASFLAIESLGAAYLPIDPDWPLARVQDMFARARPSCVLVSGPPDAPPSPAVGAATAAGIAVVSPRSGDEPDVPIGPTIVVPRTVPPDEARYVIHTSGSSGRPKGAVVEQGGLLNHLWSMVSTLGLTSSDVVAFTAPPAYVISVWQMLAVLLVGGTVAIVDEPDMRFGRRLVGAAARAGVTVMELVPTVIGWIVDEVRRGRVTADLSRLRCLISTGEKLDPGLAASVLEHLPGVVFLNAYGATECSDDVSLHLIGAGCGDRPRVPAGRPLPNVALYVLVPDGESWRSAEPGESGELWVGGMGVAAGYLNDPELTRAAFFADAIDPHSPTGRLYRTGDLAIIADGQLHCLGRADRQVKVAGNRVELDEIEAAMSRVDGVARCAAVAEFSNGQAELAVYYVADPGVRQEDLYAPLRSLLPTSMFPRRWTRLESLPLNGNGKVDYRALASARQRSSERSRRR